MTDADTDTRPRIAKRIHDLVLHELGEDIDLALLLGRPEYARAVLSLCRGSGSGELADLAIEFTQATTAARQQEVALPEQGRAPRPGSPASLHG